MSEYYKPYIPTCIKESPKDAVEIEGLDVFWMCREHLSVITQDSFGTLHCFGGGEEIESEEQLIQAVGKRIDFDEYGNCTEP